MKKCSNCGNLLIKSNFHKKLSSKDGIFSQCKSCVIQKQKQYDIVNRDKKKENIITKIKIKLKNIVVIIKIKGMHISEKEKIEIQTLK